MQGPIDIPRSLHVDTSFAATFMFSLVALLIPVLVCGIFWMLIRCILGLREENFNDRENKQHGGEQRCSSEGMVHDATCDSDE